MKTQLLTTIIILFVFGSLSAQTKVTTVDTNFIFFDYIPDVHLFNYTHILNIDINHDGIIDLKFYYVSYPHNRPTIKAMNPNCSIAFIRLSLENDSLTNKKIVWFDNQYAQQWLPSECPEKIGVKITSNSNVYFGWIRMYHQIIEYKSNLWIDKYAYCKVPNYPLLWGQTAILTGIDEPIILPQPAKVMSNGISVEIFAEKPMRNIYITALNGAKITSINPLKSKTASFNISHLTNGLYILTIEFEDKSMMNHKIMKQ